MVAAGGSKAIPITEPPPFPLIATLHYTDRDGGEREASFTCDDRCGSTRFHATVVAPYDALEGKADVTISFAPVVASCVRRSLCRGVGFGVTAGALPSTATSWTRAGDPGSGGAAPRYRSRRWVLSLPYRVRVLCAYDPNVCSAVQRIPVRAVSGYHRPAAGS